MTLTTCPDDQTLENLLLGRLPLDEIELWESHMNGCDQCAVRASSLECSDRFTDAILLPARFDSNIDGIEGMLSRGRQILEETRAQSGEETAELSEDTADGDRLNTGFSSAHSAGEHSLSFLEPAQTRGELGRLGGYRILELLGQGGMGLVFLADEEALNRQVALKVMSPALAGNEAARRRFLREARSMAAAVNDHIVPIHQVGEQNKIPYLAMPLLEGESLNDCLKREESLPISQVCRIGREVATGLAVAHKRGLIHRDIKPDNIWLEAPTGRVKILDFGLARGEEDAELTQSGTVMGTPRYMSPEQAEGQSVDHRTDLFSLGSVLYHAASGQVPFQGKSLPSTLLCVARATPEPLNQLRPDLPSAVTRLIMRLLSKEPASRGESAAAVADEFATVLDQLQAKDVAANVVLQAPANPIESIAKRSERASRPNPTSYRTGFIAAIATFAALGLWLWLSGILIKVEVPGGTIVVEIDSHEKTTEIAVLEDKTILITDPNDGKTVRVTVDKDENLLRMEKDGFMAVTKRFSLNAKDGRRVEVHFEPESPGVPGVAGVTSGSGTTESRNVAEWIIGLGGTVTVQHDGPEIGRVMDLPEGDFSIIGINVSGGAGVANDIDEQGEFSALRKLVTLRRFIVSGQAIDGQLFEYLAELPSLGYVDAQSCRELSPKYFASLHTVPTLAMLLFMDSNAGDELAEVAVANKSVDTIGFGRELTGEGLHRLTASKNITSIYIYDCPHLTAADFSYLAKIPNLNNLVIGSGHLTEAHVSQLCEMSSLTTLAVRENAGSPLTNVDIFAEFDQLETLDLSYQDLSRVDFAPLQEMAGLRDLSLRNCQLSPSQIEAISAMLPACHIGAE